MIDLKFFERLKDAIPNVSFLPLRKMTEIKKLKERIRTIEERLSLLGRTPVEEAYKNAYGNYPAEHFEYATRDQWNFYAKRWDAFQKGWEASQQHLGKGE